MLLAACMWNPIPISINKNTYLEPKQHLNHWMPFGPIYQFGQWLMAVVTSGELTVVGHCSGDCGWWWLVMVVTAKDDVSEQSLKELEKWSAKMKVKMTIFIQARARFNFSKMIIFWFIFNFIFRKWFKNEVENEWKMSEEWLLWMTLLSEVVNLYILLY